MSARRMLVMLGLLGATAVPSAVAQAGRITGTTSLRYVELRLLARDSVPQDSITGDGLLRQLGDGRVVRCIPGEEFCRDIRPGDVASSVPVLQDLEASAWGLGEGVRLFTHVRMRTAWGGSTELWPRSDEAFEVVAAYAEVERDRMRVRVGRQWKVSGLGYYTFDGVAAAARAMPTLWVEGFAGRSLLRGLAEPRTSGALESVEPFAPTEPGILAGLHARYRPSPRLAVSALYQVDFEQDRSSVYSELAAIDGVLRVGGGSIEGAMEADVASGALNEARVAVRSPPVRQVAFHGELRRYRPYFEQWTIWGAFSPVGFDEARAGATWVDRRGTLVVRGEASRRDYDDAQRDEAIADFRGAGWGFGASAGWSPQPPWRLEGSYRLERGFGASRRDAHVGVARQLAGGGSLGLSALAFERLFEFRLAEGTVVGLGADASLPLSDRTRLVASVSAYRHLDRGDAAIDWNQRRASLRFQWTLGDEPGVSLPGVRR